MLRVENFLDLTAVGAVSLMAAISPGPDFFIILKNSFCSRRAGFLTALGALCALTIHLSYTLVGIGILIQKYSLIYNIMKYGGAFYLLYIGYTSFKSSFKQLPSSNILNPKTDEEISDKTAFRQGFFTNLLNPKAAVFFISLFSQFITQETPVDLKIKYALINWGITLIWFSLLVYIVTGNFFMKKFGHFHQAIDRIMGAILILLSMKIIFV